MGLDFLDIRFQCDKQFGIKLDQNELFALAKPALHKKSRLKIDIRVGDLVALIEATVQRQNPDNKLDVFETLKKIIADCLAADESEVRLDTWLVQDLGMNG